MKLGKVTARKTRGGGGFVVSIAHFGSSKVFLMKINIDLNLGRYIGPYIVIRDYSVLFIVIRNICLYTVIV